MGKLSREDQVRHSQAEEILTKTALTHDEKEFVLDNYQPGGRHMNAMAGAFFTPRDLARDMMIEVGGLNVVDLCAGIGSLAYAYEQATYEEHKIVCLEINPDYVEVGKKIVPEAEWICADIREYCFMRGEFDCAFSNPPFGRVNGVSNFEYVVVEKADWITGGRGTFILPQTSTPYKFSGHSHFERVQSTKYEGWSKKTGLTFDFNCGLDTSVHQDSWNGIKPPHVEIVSLGEGI